MLPSQSRSRPSKRIRGRALVGTGVALLLVACVDADDRRAFATRGPFGDGGAVASSHAGASSSGRAGGVGVGGEPATSGGGANGTGGVGSAGAAGATSHSGSAGASGSVASGGTAGSNGTTGASGTSGVTNGGASGEGGAGGVPTSGAGGVPTGAGGLVTSGAAGATVGAGGAPASGAGGVGGNSGNGGVAGASPGGTSSGGAGPTCDDGARDGEETDVDCGGPSCGPCVLGATCVTDFDCEASICKDAVCTSRAPLSFLSPVAFQTCEGVPVTGDFDGDAELDVAVVCDSGIHMLPGHGDATFGAPSASDGEVKIEWALRDDFDHDGDLDLLVAGDEPSSSAFVIAVHANDGHGSFTLAWSSSSFPFEFFSFPKPVLGDVDGDGNTDLVLVTQSPSAGEQLWVAHGNGNASFQAFAPVFATNGTAAIAAGDVDGDGADDVVVNRGGNLDVIVKLGGTPVVAASLASPSTIAAAVSDGDGDGKLDVAALRCSMNCSVFDAIVFPGDGNGAFSTAVPTSLPPSPPLAAAGLGDHDGDGRVDYAPKASTDARYLFSGAADGSFARSSGVLVAASSMGAPVADFDHDGRIDPVFSTPTGVAIAATGASAPHIQPAFYAPGPHVLVGDFDGDHRADLAFGIASTELARGIGDESFLPWTVVNPSEQPTFVGDIDGNGIADLIAGSTVHLNPGTASASAHALTFPSPVGMGDFDGDGRADLIAVTGSPAISAVVVGRSNGDGTFTTGAPVQVTSTAKTLRVEDVDRDGRADVHLGDRILFSDAAGELTNQVVIGDGIDRFVDWDGDGLRDGIGGGPPPNGTPAWPQCGNVISCMITVRKNLGGWTFGAAMDTGLAGSVDEVADFDGDGRDEIVLTQPTYFDGSYGVPTSFVYRARGAGDWEPIFTADFGDCPLVAGDVDGDGRLDLIRPCADATAYLSKTP